THVSLLLFFFNDPPTTEIYTLSLHDALPILTKYTGRPAMIATSVITEKFVDLAKRLPPPMTADEEALSRIMKQFPPALAALRTAVDGSKLEDATKNAAVLKQGFTDTESFWKPKKAE